MNHDDYRVSNHKKVMTGRRTFIQRCISPKGIPTATSLRAWAEKARHGEGGELLIRIVDTEESAALNEQYRGKNGPTNVLSFGYKGSSLVEEMMLGDVVICAPVVAREAETRHIEPRSHWAHMVVHGVLHLRGFDHVLQQEAILMEHEESAIITSLGFLDPYVITDSTP